MQGADVRMTRGPRWGLNDAAVGAIGAVILTLLASLALARGWGTDARLAEVLAYGVFWGPLFGVVLAASLWRGSGSLGHDFGLRFRPLDLLWGLTIGLLARLAASVIEIAGYGRLGTGAATLGSAASPQVGSPGWWIWLAGVLVLGLLAPVVIAPFIEELFFRGLLLRAVQRVTDARPAVALAVAALVSASVFALLHVVGSGSIIETLVVGTGTFVFGLAAASVTAVTGRLGSAILAHVVFNGLVVVPALLG